MQYRKLGKTGQQAGIIGLGTEFLDNKPYAVVEEVIHSALEQRINFLDLFMPGEQVRRNIGRALSGNREKVIIQGHIGSVDINRQYDISRDPETCKKYFDNLLRCLDTDYIDIGMLFFMDSQEEVDLVLENGVADYAYNLKKQGVLRAVGASCHNPETAKRLVQNDLIDHLMFSINPAFDMMPDTANIMEMLDDNFNSRPTAADRSRAELYRLCQSKEISISVMKMLGAGKLLSKEHCPFRQPLTVSQCIHYALSRPAVASVLIGCQSKDEVLEAVGYLQASEREKDYAPCVSAFRANTRGDFKGGCMYCSHCQPCPANIDIAAVNKYLDIALLNEAGIPPAITQLYRALDNHGSDCIACGSCEKRCPFGVKVMHNMRRAETLFGL